MSRTVLLFLAAVAAFSPSKMSQEARPESCIAGTIKLCGVFTWQMPDRI